MITAILLRQAVPQTGGGRRARSGGGARRGTGGAGVHRSPEPAGRERVHRAGRGADPVGGRRPPRWSPGGRSPSCRPGAGRVVFVVVFMGVLAVCLTGVVITGAVEASRAGRQQPVWLPLLIPLSSSCRRSYSSSPRPGAGCAARVLLRFTGGRLGAARLRAERSLVRRDRARGTAFSAVAPASAAPAASPSAWWCCGSAIPSTTLPRSGPVTRWLLRRGTRKYSSPITIAVGPRFPISLEQLLATRAHYTEAPVSWTHPLSRSALAGEAGRYPPR